MSNSQKRPSLEKANNCRYPRAWKKNQNKTFSRNFGQRVQNFGQNLQYYSTKYNFYPTWAYRMRPTSVKCGSKPRRKEPSPPPFSGSEEYNLQKIKEASDLIKMKLLMPEGEEPVVLETTPVNETLDEGEKQSDKSLPRPYKKTVQYNVEEIHQKIVSHITKLSHSKKINLIYADTSGYDVAIQQIHKQKRLELSKVLRDMCSNQNLENSEVINSLIPDIGVKIEDLPLEVIQELSSTLGMSFDDGAHMETSSLQVKTEIEDTESLLTNVEDFNSQIDVEENCFQIDKHDELVVDIPSVKEEIVDTEARKEDNDQEENCVEMNGFSLDPSKASATTQTPIPCLNSVSVQTEESFNGSKSDTLDAAVKKMFEIDREILRLMQIKQSIYANMEENHQMETTQREVNNSEEIRSGSVNCVNYANPIKVEDNSGSEMIIQEKDLISENVLNFEKIAEKILVMQVVEDTLLAATENGNVYYFDTANGTTTVVIKICGAPITAFVTFRTLTKRKLRFFVGSSAPKMYEVDFAMKKTVGGTKIKGGVQCMEHAWNYVFIGTSSGHLLRYSLRCCRIEFEENLSNDRIMVLKATQEGARRVLLVGLRNQPVCVRDAMSGLHLRTMNGLITPTVYSLILEKSMVYCGTTMHDLLVFSFHDGRLVFKHEVANSKGISCMKVVENLLFASCYDGNVYVFNVKTHKYVGLMAGPGGVILSMEIVKNLVIVGTMSLNFQSIVIPERILEDNRI